jgi:hypothetical protein
VLCSKLTNMFDHVVPCFPPAYEPFKVLVAAYHTHVGQLLERLARKADGHPNQASTVTPITTGPKRSSVRLPCEDGGRSRTSHSSRTSLRGSQPPTAMPP